MSDQLQIPPARCPRMRLEAIHLLKHPIYQTQIISDRGTNHWPLLSTTSQPQPRGPPRSNPSNHGTHERFARLAFSCTHSHQPIASLHSIHSSPIRSIPRPDLTIVWFGFADDGNAPSENMFELWPLCNLFSHMERCECDVYVGDYNVVVLTGEARREPYH